MTKPSNKTGRGATRLERGPVAPAYTPPDPPGTRPVVSSDAARPGAGDLTDHFGSLRGRRGWLMVWAGILLAAGWLVWAAWYAGRSGPEGGVSDGPGSVESPGAGPNEPDELRFRATPPAAAAALDRSADAPASGFLRPVPLGDLGKSHKVRLVYFVPADREPVARYRAKIRTTVTFVNDIYCRSLREQGYATEGLDFHFADGGPQVRLLRGDRPAAYYSGAPDYRFVRTWQRVLPEVERLYGSATENLYVIFVESYDPGPAAYEWPGGVALGARFGPGGGAGMFSAWILRDEFCAPTIEGQLAFLADDTAITGRTALGSGTPDSPRYEFIEDGFGAVLHEMGHAFGLVHDKRNERQYIMGNGFRHLRHNYLPALQAAPIGFSPANAAILAWSPFLAPSPQKDDTRPPDLHVEIEGHRPDAAGSISLSLQIDDGPGGSLGGYLVYAQPPLDTVLAGNRLVGAYWQATLDFTLPSRPAEPVGLKVLAIDRSGNLAQQEITLPIGP